MAWAKRKILNFVEEILAHGMHMSIRNVELRYEDDGVLASSRQRVTAGVRVASVMVRAQGSKEAVEEIRSFRSRSRWLDEVADVDAQSSPTRPSTQHKRRLRNGVRCALAVERACCYWDVGKHDVPFTVKLMERSGVDHVVTHTARVDPVRRDNDEGRGSGTGVSHVLQRDNNPPKTNLMTHTYPQKQTLSIYTDSLTDACGPWSFRMLKKARVAARRCSKV